MGIGTGWEMWINSRRKRRQTFPTTTTDCCMKRNYIYSLCPMHLWSLCKDTRHIQCPKRLQGWHLPPDQWADKGMEMLLHLCYSSGLCWLPCSDRNTKTTYDGDVYNVGKKYLPCPPDHQNLLSQLWTFSSWLLHTIPSGLCMAV